MKACIFDLDGTLADTLESMSVSANQVIKTLGYAPLPRENFRYYAGDGAKTLIERVLRDAGDKKLEHFEEVYRAYSEIFDKDCTYKVIVFDGMRETLEKLKTMGIKLAVLSNKPHAQTKKVISSLFGDDLFDWVQGQQEGIPRKPDPYAAIQIAEKFGVKPEECVYIGDSEVDVATGTAARMKTLGVTWGFRSVEQLKEAGATILLDRPVQILEEINKGGI